MPTIVNAITVEIYPGVVSVTPVGSYVENGTRVNRMVYCKVISNGVQCIPWAYQQLDENADGNYFQAVPHSDLPVAGNYVGTSHADFMRWRPSIGEWFRTDGASNIVAPVVIMGSR